MKIEIGICMCTYVFWMNIYSHGRSDQYMLIGASKTKDVSATQMSSEKSNAKHKKIKKCSYIKFEYAISRENSNRRIVNHLAE